MKPRQFDLVTLSGGRFAVILQNDLIALETTRVVIPAFRSEDYSADIDRLNRKITCRKEEFILMPASLQTLPLAAFLDVVDNLEDQRDEIIRAIDMLISGV